MFSEEELVTCDVEVRLGESDCEDVAEAVGQTVAVPLRETLCVNVIDLDTVGRLDRVFVSESEGVTT